MPIPEVKDILPAINDKISRVVQAPTAPPEASGVERDSTDTQTPAAAPPEVSGGVRPLPKIITSGLENLPSRGTFELGSLPAGQTTAATK